MALTSFNLSILFFFFFFCIFFIIPSSTLSVTAFTHHDDNQISIINSFCSKTPYSDTCFESLKLSISIDISPNILNLLLQTLQTALSEALKLHDLLSDAGDSDNLVEGQRGAIQDCQDLHQITLSSLNRSLSNIHVTGSDSRKMADARAYLSAAVTNKNTCLEGLDSASGPLKLTLLSSIDSTYKHVSNALSALPKPEIKGGCGKTGHKNRRLLGFPRWVSRKTRRFLEGSEDDDDDEYDPNEILTVAADGTGNFTTITDAINFAANQSDERIIIYVREGEYNENVEIPSYKTNIVLIGDGADVTFITGNRSVGDGWTTFGSATLAVSGEGFLARDITIANTAGPGKHQAVALRVNADLVAFYRCVMDGYQDTLYVHSFRQFYRECDIYGTIDYIFGNAAVIFQGCNIVSKMPMPDQFTVVTAQSRSSPDETTGISLQNCTIVAAKDLCENSSVVKSYLGRPWKEYSRTVVMESYIGGFIDELGWIKWPISDGRLKSLYYGEYDNYGPGSETEHRVNWTGYHVMDCNDAFSFTVSEFIAGDWWLASTSFPFDDGV